VATDPDGGQCIGAMAYHVDRGSIAGVDVSGLTFASAVHIPGNVTAGGWRLMAFVDDKATKAQEKALLDAFTGKLGGTLADIAGLIGEVVSVERAAITFEFSQGTGTLKVGKSIDAVTTALVGATGKPTVLADTAFSTIPGSPAYCAKSDHYRLDAPGLGHSIDISGRNAIHGDFLFEAV
jgi:hypothetical protein